MGRAASGRSCALCATLLALLGCVVPAQVRYERELESKSAEGRHGVHSQRLLELMAGLERLRVERLPTSMDLRGAEAVRARELEQVGRGLAASARAIPAATEGVAMSDRDRADFLRMASDLEAAAQRLGESATESAESIRAQIDEIDATCNGCHARFRIAGELDAH